MSTAAGGMTSQPAVQSCAISVAPASPMLVFVSATTRSAPNMPSIRGDGSVPSESAITDSTSAAATSEPARTAANVALHTSGPSVAGADTSACSTITESVAVRANCARLNATLAGDRPRTKRRMSAGPAICATIRSCGVASSRPATSGSSESESVCALPRKWAWMTKTSVTANAAASAHHGTCTPSVYAGRSRTNAR